MSYPNPIPPMTEEERAAFRSFLLRRYVLSILALVLGIAGAVLLLRRGVDGPPLMEAVWVCLFVLSGGTAVLGGRAWGRYQTLLTEPEAMERTWQARRAGPQTEADQSYRRDVSRSGRLGLLLLALDVGDDLVDLRLLVLQLLPGGLLLLLGRLQLGPAGL